MISGVLNINKPDSISSFQVVSFIKRKYKIKKIGHLGTLDPMGSGVLPIAVGRATKLFDLFLNKKKVYRAYFYFGKETDTLDSEGSVINEIETTIDIECLRSVCQSMVGEYEQIPPKYSAKSINGVRAYELARDNKDFYLPPKLVSIFRCEVISEITKNLFLLEIECSAGCYIRSICRDIAYKLETVAYMPLIIRVDAGNFKIEKSIAYSELENIEDIEKYLTPIDDCLPFDKIYLDAEQFKKIANGLRIDINKDDGKYLLYDDNNSFFAVGIVEDKILKMEIYFGD